MSDRFWACANAGAPAGRSPLTQAEFRDQKPITWAKTRFGGIDLAKPDPADVRIEDMAHHLARNNRYNGGCEPEHYSVAEHCVRLSIAAQRLGWPVFDQLHTLLHDAHEYILGDQSYPFLRLRALLDDGKSIIVSDYELDEFIRPFKEAMDRAIFEALGIDPPGPELRERIKVIDRRIVADEMIGMMFYEPAGIEPLGEIIRTDGPYSAWGWAPRTAARIWRVQLESLMSQLEQEQEQRP